METEGASQNEIVYVDGTYEQGPHGGQPEQESPSWTILVLHLQE